MWLNFTVSVVLASHAWSLSVKTLIDQSILLRQQTRPRFRPIL